MSDRTLFIPLRVAFDSLDEFLGGGAVEVVFRGVALEAESAIAGLDLLIPLPPRNDVFGCFVTSF